jgi:16S rRNA (guanine527-N7)-methyltransferase
MRNEPTTAADIARAVIAILLPQLQLRELSLDAAALARIERIAAAIAVWGSRFNLTAHPEDPSELARHILDSLAPLFASAPEAIAATFRAKHRVLDLGSGAGFPGLVLASTTPARFVIAESRRRRASFLEVAAREAELANVVIDARRLEPGDLNADFDSIIARAFARPREFWRMADSALTTGGIAILWARRGQRLDLDDARAFGLSLAAEFEYSIEFAHGVVDHMLIAMRKAR